MATLDNLLLSVLDLRNVIFGDHHSHLADGQCLGLRNDLRITECLWLCKSAPNYLVYSQFAQ